MPVSTILILTGIVCAFAIFGFTLAWADYQTRHLSREGKKPEAATEDHREFRKAA